MASYGLELRLASGVTRGKGALVTLHVAPELAPAKPRDPSFRGGLWVKKGWNLFRGVLEARFHDDSPEVVARQVREIVRRVLGVWK